MRLTRMFIVIGTSLALVLGLSAHKAYAHFPVTTGSLTAILHVEPEDYPAAGQPEKLYLIFSDAANRFRLSDCTCNLAIVRQNNFLSSAILSPNTDKNSVYTTQGVPFTFPAAGSYQLVLDGQPRTNGLFKPFNLAWNIAVGSPVQPPKGTPIMTLLKYVLAIAAAFIMLGAMVFVIS